MVKSCAVDTCRHRGDPPEGGKRSYFRFPLRYPLICGEWVAAIKKPDYVPTRNSFVCQDHFAATDILVRDQRKILKRHAVPFFPQKANRPGRPTKGKYRPRPATGWQSKKGPWNECHSYAKGHNETEEEAGAKIRRLERRLKELGLKAQRHEKTIERLKRSLDAKEEEKLRLHFDLARENPVQKLSGLTRALIEHEIDNHAKSKVSHRFGHQVREFGAKIYELSPQVYAYMKTIFTLPAERTLTRFKARCLPSPPVDLAFEQIHPLIQDQTSGMEIQISAPDGTGHGDEPSLTQNISSWMSVLK
ncbi:hypothetical protein TCAL_12593 [Tigriopus californicus]|uniref:THAP-type domain-containing protein n=1 Tax=Tigriopus californicus TaxID=6832 RepID=A0A553PDL8_TIGCA|nr:hypothetical protein TCAL_12593 [Tigriopus californicus]|eukprot:TCALIF_12593-PA protein Name:"Similar to thap1 THAP domain-containing protein 1 (Xenopus tropicalis)" AED:0.22 eAED:0.23 QI:0/-1/0/1/-1/1/1/0/303